jgi:flagellar biosynthetic protein FliR
MPMENVFTYELFLQWWGNFFWPLVRIGALMFIMPVLSAKTVSVRFKLIVTLMLTAAIAPSVELTKPIDPFTNEGLWMAVEQAGIGLAMGLVFVVVFQAFTLAGQMVANAMGLGFASMVDPGTGMNSPVIAQLYIIMISLLFVTLNGHLMVVQMLIDSFVQMPLNGHFLSILTIKALVGWGSNLFSWAMIIALPAVTALLLANIALGLISRAAPTLNVFSIGFVITIVGGLLLLWWLLPQIPIQFQWFMNQSFDFVHQFKLSE